MKKIVQFMKVSILVSLLTLVFSTEVKAQDFSPFYGDNYAGITGVVNNPASIANTRYAFDATIFGVSTWGAQNYFDFQRNFIFNQMHPSRKKRDLYRSYWTQKPWLLPEDADKSGKYIRIPARTERSYDGIVENEIQLFNFMIAFGPKFSIGITDRIRSYSNIDRVPWNVLDSYFAGREGLPLNEYGVIGDANMRGVSAVWNQVGLTLASQIWNGGNHYFKLGVTVNAIKGLSSAYFLTKDASFEYIDQKNVKLNGDYILGASQDLFKEINSLRENKPRTLEDCVHSVTNNFFRDPFAKENWQNLTFGLDAGIVYEWRPDYQDYIYDLDGKTGLIRRDLNQYRIKVSAAVLDIPLNGGIKYNYDQSLMYNTFNIKDGMYNIDQLTTLQNKGEITVDETLAAGAATAGEIGADSVYQITLPTRFTFSVDFRLAKYFYVNLGSSVPFAAFKKYEITEFNDNAKTVINLHSDARFNITPRYERKWFGLAVPVQYNLLNSDQVSVGLGLRLGPVWIGSNNLFSTMIKEYNQQFDLCAAIKIPIFYGSPKDTDRDGVSDKLDECPYDPGTWETRGCPDFDGDGIVDHEDECPCDPGLPEFNGCPDTDGDGIPDHLDDCPDVPGLPEYNGCPDTDGDGIPDHLDVCPDEPGTPERKGCPESMFIQDTDGDGIPDHLDDCPLIPGTIENNGCPDEALTYSFDYATVNFDINKYNIKSPADEILDKVVTLTKNNKTVSIKVVGHADITGNDAINDPLSVNRAESVKSYLVKRGVDGSIITTEGRGSHDPVATNSTRAGRAKNRRVDLEVSFIKK